jgi:peptidoglycan-associated lipoprotein
MFTFSTRKKTIALAGLSLMLVAAGCKKKVVAPPPPPPPPAAVKETPPPTPPAPVVSQFSAEPTSIQRGQSATLRWEVSGSVNSVSIDQGIGTVQNTGNRRVTPTDSVTYTLTATGPGGSSTGSATVSVNAPPPPVVTPPPSRPDPLDIQITSKLQDALFDYDKSDIRDEARDVLTRDAAALKGILADFPNAVIIVEGHCDERGSAEYNLGLGDRRASAAKDFLVQLGVPESRLRTVSFGKERPQCTDANEACYQRNRRAHFSPGQ